MSEKLLVPARKIETEFIDNHSRFITNAGPFFSVDEAQTFIDEVKEKYPDASHHVPVFLIGHGASTIAHCSDDGEPSGTAGRPALAVLKGSGLGDIAVVITRYYGGRKLGTGGLVRAYSDSMRLVLESLPLARKLATTTLMFVIPYALFEQTRLIIHHHAGKVRDEVFGANVTLTVSVSDECLEGFRGKMVSLVKGEIEFIILEHCENTIIPIT